MTKAKTKLANHVITEADPPEATSGIDTGPEDSIANNRRLPLITTDTIPPVPEGFRPILTEERRRRLRVVATTLHADVIQALEESAKQGDLLKQDLGDLAPDFRQATTLATRIESAQEAINKVKALLHYLETIEDIALSDAIIFLEALYSEYAHRVSRIPQLAQKYPKLIAIIEARNGAISEGRARAKSAVAKKAAP